MLPLIHVHRLREVCSIFVFEKAYHKKMSRFPYPPRTSQQQLVGL